MAPADSVRLKRIPQVPNCDYNAPQPLTGFLSRDKLSFPHNGIRQHQKVPQ